MYCPADRRACKWHCNVPCTSDDTRLVIESLDGAGNVLERHEGPTMAERKNAHEQGTCDALCAFCYTEATEPHPKVQEK